MIQLDGIDLNAFIPFKYGEFGSELIREGTNAGFKIGHDIFTVEELENAWPLVPVPTEGERAAAMLASLLFPDRTAWFLLQPASAE